MKEKDFIDKWAEQLPMENSVSQLEAERRASTFLTAMAHITNWRLLYANEKIRADSVERATYSHVLHQLDGKKITENKILVEADGEYQLRREEMEQIDNRVQYLKQYFDLFNNAHIFYRNLANGDLA